MFLAPTPPSLPSCHAEDPVDETDDDFVASIEQTQTTILGTPEDALDERARVSGIKRTRPVSEHEEIEKISQDGESIAIQVVLVHGQVV